MRLKLRFVFLLCFLVLMFTVPGIVHAQGPVTATPEPTAGQPPAPVPVQAPDVQTILNAVVPIAIAAIFAVPLGIVAVLVLIGHMVLNSPVILAMLKHLADSLSPQWQDVIRTTGQIINKIEPPDGSSTTINQQSAPQT